MALQNLIMLLASDGETLRRSLGRSLPGDIAGTAAAIPAKRQDSATQSKSDMKIGCLQIVLAIRSMLDALPEGADFSALLLLASA